MSRHVPTWMTIVVLSLCGMVSALQFTLVIPLLPEFPGLLDISTSNSSWLVTATLLTAAVSTPVVARMADMYGKRRMLSVALGAMIVGSVICAMEVSFLTMIAGRALQGFGASLIAVGISLLRDKLPPERIGSAVALMSATMGIGSALGLPLAGVLTDWLVGTRSSGSAPSSERCWSWRCSWWSRSHRCAHRAASTQSGRWCSRRHWYACCCRSPRATPGDGASR